MREEASFEVRFESFLRLNCRVFRKDRHGSIAKSAHGSGSESSHASGSESAHVEGLIAKSTIGSGDNEQAASSDKATSLDSVPGPRNDDPTPVDGEPNRWVSPTKADNQLTWDRAVMVAALVAGLEIDFARILLAEIHERVFKSSTTYLFPCLIF
ncbi:hypothetical protein H5410_003247 [Solanum commersonii]|uniref:Putative plant transposon protein domain-containing protein n=1 Tax=Solanum commersonii TaxID=4109 RepID=A0A9J6B4K6_SOLCO|nr:hypothetical protein H5410_003247 [Solanum commersonii]